MNSSDVARKPIIFGVVDQKAFNIVAVYLIIELSVNIVLMLPKKSCASSAPKPPGLANKGQKFTVITLYITTFCPTFSKIDMFLVVAFYSISSVSQY